VNDKYAVKMSVNMFSRFGTIPESNGRTDTLTDRQTDRHITRQTYYNNVIVVSERRRAVKCIIDYSK